MKLRGLHPSGGLLGTTLVAAVIAAAATWMVARWIRGPSAPLEMLPSFLSPACAALLAAFLASIATAKRLARPLRPILESARRWSHGDLSHRVQLSRGELLAPVAESLNRMAAALARREDDNLRRVEERILEAERLATTGRLAAGVAHEINNPLGGILLCGDLLLESTDVGDPRRENMERIVAQAARAREIVRGLLDFARQSPQRYERADLNRIVADVLALLERQPLYQRAQHRLEMSPSPIWSRVDVAKMQQVFINIVMNALEAMREGGTLTVRTGYSEREGYCRVAISDTGFGIPEENLSRLFEPFFTTKEVGKGVGLGLAISHGIVRQHKGEIEVQSAVGSGTTFRVLLPVDKEV